MFMRNLSYNKRREVFFFDLIVFDGETELDHSVDSVGELRGIVKGESGSQEGSFEQQPDQILNGLVALIGIALLLQVADDSVVGVDFHSLLGGHVRGHGGVSKAGVNKSLKRG